MATTKTDYPTQLGRNPVIDARALGATGDGTTNDTAAIQAALDQAGSTTPTGSATVQLPRGRFLCTTALVFKHNGIILQGFGMMGTGGETGFGGIDGICSTIVANNSHDNTPMIRMNPIDGGSTQYYRGTCLRDISIDVSGSTRFTTGTPPDVIQIRELSNCPEFVNVMTFGSIGTSLSIGPNASLAGGPISENLTFRNCYFFGGYGTNSAVPTGPGVLIQGSDNIQFHGGFISYYYAPGNLPVNNNTTDFAGLQIIPAVVNNSGSVNQINNGFRADGVTFTGYVVAVRLSNVDIGGICWCPQNCRFLNLTIENYNKAFAINQEPTSFPPAGNRSPVYIERCSIGGTRYGASPTQVLGSRMLGGHIQLQFLNLAGDLNLDSTCTGVPYDIGTNPNSFVFYDATDTGSNDGRYQKNGFIGRLLAGQTRCMGTVAPSTANAGTAGADVALQCWGDTVKIFNTTRNLGGAATSSAGQIGELVAWFDGSQYWVAICFGSGAAGTAIWRRSLMSSW